MTAEKVSAAKTVVTNMYSWGGCDYECIPNSGSGYHGCGAVQENKGRVPGRYFPWPSGGPDRGGRPGGQGADAYPWYGEIMTDLLPNITKGAGVVYNKTVQSKYFNWQHTDGSTHQVWYDDPDTLRVKYRLAKQAGMRALGVWGSGAPLHDAALAQKMWDAIPAPRKDHSIRVGNVNGSGTGATAPRRWP